MGGNKYAIYNKPKISKLITYLLSHNQYGYQNKDIVIETLSQCGWSEEELKNIFLKTDKPCYEALEDLQDD